MSLSLRRSLAVARNELLLLRHERSFLVVFTLLPVAVMAVVQPSLRRVLVADGYAGANGAEQAVPGLAVTFAFFLVGYAALGFFREHGWGTWSRLRTTPLTAGELLLGKAAPYFGLSLLQLSVMTALGFVVFGVDSRGSLLLLVPIFVAFSATLISLMLALVSLCGSSQQVNALSNVTALLCGGLGGGFTPVDALPTWAQPGAPLTPSYWAIRGIRGVVLDGAGVATVGASTATLLGCTAVFTGIALGRFRMSEAKSPVV